jgi:hypothetical protein
MENREQRVDIFIRCIHPNLNWKPDEGPDYRDF